MKEHRIFRQTMHLKSIWTIIIQIRKCRKSMQISNLNNADQMISIISLIQLSAKEIVGIYDPYN